MSRILHEDPGIEARRRAARRTALVAGAVALAIFVLSLLQGLKYS
jgi:hypothetical protein